MKQNMKITWLMVLIVYLPSLAETDRYRLSWRENPATSMTVGWNQVDGNAATVYYGTEDLGTNVEQYPSSKESDAEYAQKGMNNTFARLTNLQPDTRYYFVIKDDNSTSERFYFDTAPSRAANAKLSLVYGGDSRSSRSGRQKINRMVSKIRPLAVIFGGDYIDVSNNTSWRDWLTDWQLTIGEDGKMIPISPTRGNHEYDEDVSRIFDTPTADIVYTLSFGGDLFQSWILNSERGDISGQGDWLSSSLQENADVLWKMVSWHTPISPIGPKDFESVLWNNWAEILYDNRVNLAGESHSHVVKRTWPMRPSSSGAAGYTRDDENGTVYIGEGSWGVPVRSIANNYPWVQGSGAFNEFNWLQITPTSFKVMTIRSKDDVSNIQSVSDENPFELPNGFELWEPQGGDAITSLNPYVTPTEGCTDPAAANFNESAHVDDGTCESLVATHFAGASQNLSIAFNVQKTRDVNFLLTLKDRSKANIKIWDKKGGLLYQKKITSGELAYNFKLPVEFQNKNGVFFIQLTQGRNKVSRPFTILQ